MPRGGARRADTQEALVKQLGQLLADPKARDAVLVASERVVEQLGGALERTLTALEPYLLQVAARDGKPPMREPGFWHGPASLQLASPETARRALRRHRGEAPAAQGIAMPAFPCSASATTTSAAPARRRPCWRLQNCCANSARRRSCSAAAMADKLRGPVRVDPGRHAASDVGDEPLMLAGHLPVVVARKRAEGVAAGACAGRDRDRDGRWLPDPGGRQGRVADRDRCRTRDRQRAGVSRGSAARAAAAATGAHRRADRCRQRRRRRTGRSRDRRAGQAGAASASEAGRGAGGLASRQARAGVRRHRRSRAILQHAARQRHRRGPRARLRRSSSVFASRDRNSDRRRRGATG